MDGEQEPVKPSFEFSEVSVHKSDGEGDGRKRKYYLICGERSIFILNEEDYYSRELTAQEIDDLNFSVTWNGPKPKVKYESNDEKAIESLLKIINNVNLLQNKEYYGLILASMITHLRAFMYEDILDTQKGFITTITVSGEQRGTGETFHNFSKSFFGCGLGLG